MAVNNADSIKYFDLLKNVGRATANAMFPNDFEYYVVALELVGYINKNGNNKSTSELFVFPIMPDRITEEKVNLVNIKKTIGGVTTLKNNTFIPKNISLNGTFGRTLKFLTNRGNVIDLDAVHFSEFNTKLKTGYGCLKILESICEKSRQLDDSNKPFKLFFYNPALGNSYLVEVENLTLPQTKEQNMMWNYNLKLKAIAPIKSILSVKEIRGALANITNTSVIDKTIKTFTKNITNIIGVQAGKNILKV